MEKELRIVGTCGNLPFDNPAASRYHPPMRFLEYVTDDSGQICGAKYEIDLGHGYGFDNGTEVVVINIGEEIRFEHGYTDVSDGKWDYDSFQVVVRLIENGGIN